MLLLTVLGRWENRGRHRQGQASQHQCDGPTNYVTASSWVMELFPNVSYFGPQRFSSADFNCSKSLPTERACDHSKLIRRYKSYGDQSHQSAVCSQLQPCIFLRNVKGKVKHQ